MTVGLASLGVDHGHIWPAGHFFANVQVAFHESPGIFFCQRSDRASTICSSLSSIRAHLASYVFSKSTFSKSSADLINVHVAVAGNTAEKLDQLSLCRVGCRGL